MDDIILVSGGFDPVHSGHIALIKEAARTGTLENASFNIEAEEPDETIVNELRQQVQELQAQLNTEQQETFLSKKSLKETAMEHIVRLAAMDDMNSLSK